MRLPLNRITFFYFLNTPTIMKMQTQITNNEMQNQLTKLNNKNFYWASLMGNCHIWDSETDEWIICIDENRIYFNECGKLSHYKYLPEFDIIFESRELAKIASAAIINTEF